MNGLIILVPVALGLGMLGLAAFFWSVRNGQLDDMDGPAMRILLDDEPATGPSHEPATSPSQEPGTGKS